MEQVQTIVNDLVENTETVLNRGLDNVYISTTIKVLIGLYAAFAAPKLPASLVDLMDNIFVRIGFAFVIVLVATRDPSIALMIAIAFIVTLQTANKLRLFNTELSVAAPGQSSWLPSAKREGFANEDDEEPFDGHEKEGDEEDEEEEQEDDAEEDQEEDEEEKEHFMDSEPNVEEADMNVEYYTGNEPNVEEGDDAVEYYTANEPNVEEGGENIEHLTRGRNVWRPSAHERKLMEQARNTHTHSTSKSSAHLWPNMGGHAKEHFANHDKEHKHDESKEHFRQNLSPFFRAKRREDFQVMQGSNISSNIETNPPAAFTTDAQFEDAQSNHVDSSDQLSCVKSMANQHCAQGLSVNSPIGA